MTLRRNLVYRRCRSPNKVDTDRVEWEGVAMETGDYLYTSDGGEGGEVSK